MDNGNPGAEATHGGDMDPIPAVRRFLHWHRRILAAALAGIAVLITLTHLDPASGALSDVVVTTRSLAAGDVVGPTDVTLAALPPDSLPDGAPLDLDDVIGQTMAMRALPHSVVQAGMLATSQITGPGRALVPMALPDPRLADLLTPGSTITLVHVSHSGFDVLTDSARVGALPPEPDRPALSTGAGSSPMVLVDVPQEVAATVAVLGQAGELTIILGGA